MWYLDWNIGWGKGLSGENLKLEILVGECLKGGFEFIKGGYSWAIMV